MMRLILYDSNRDQFDIAKFRVQISNSGTPA